MEQFIIDAKLTMEVLAAHSNPNMEQDPKHPMDHWSCMIYRKADRAGPPMQIHFSQSMGRRKLKHPHMQKEWDSGIPSHDKMYWEGMLIPVKPTLGAVLECLTMDSSVDGQSFEDWASDLGMDTDSRKAERTFQVCNEQTQALRALLGHDLFQRLLTIEF